MIEPVEAISGVGEWFDANGVEWLIGGSLASSIHGDFRATQDVDCMARVAARHAEPMERALSESYYLSAIAIRHAVASASSFNLIHLTTYMKVDVFVAADDDWTALQLARAARIPIECAGTTVQLPFASPEDIVLQKLRWFRRGGEQSTHQLTDVQSVLRIQQAAIDHAYLDRWAARIGVTDLLNRIRATLPAA